jgi:prepilin-type N-terminal cleavage/methylation domain-containing protein
MRFWQKIINIYRRESGFTFMETVIALAILGAISVSFLNGLTTASKSVFIADEHSTAESLAQSQMEWVKDASYSYNATTYTSAPIPDGKDYQHYSAVITAEALHGSDDGIQKVTVTIRHDSQVMVRLEGYKADR